MKNNETIIAFLKENLGKDLNNDYNELGCAQTVNNALLECLGYVAGGGPSTAKMLVALEDNPNFKEVTRNEARAGDIILSATGTGNGKIDHGHVGFLGENGIIYSNNSAKDMLDDHLTAQDWKNYFVLKGGFPVRYFRAIGEPLKEWKPKAKLPKVLQSSQNPDKVSLTVKSLLVMGAGLLAQRYGITISPEDIDLIQSNLMVIAPAIVALFGIARKYL